MIRNYFRTCAHLFIVLIFAFIFAFPVFAEPHVGMLLEEAMLARKTGTVSDVSDKFMVAANAASSFNLRSKILFIFSDYLMEKKEWEKAIQIQCRIIDYGSPASQASAFYNLILANIQLNNIDSAGIAAAQLNAIPSGKFMREHAHTMKKLAPNSIYARVSDLLVEAALNVPAPGPACLKIQPAAFTQIATDTGVEAMALQEMPVPAEQKLEGFSLLAGGWNSLLRGDLDSQGMSLDFGSDISSGRQTSLSLAAEIYPSLRDKFRAIYHNFSFSGALKKKIIHNAIAYYPGDNFFMRSEFVDFEGFRELQMNKALKWGALYGVMLTDSDLEVKQTVPGIRQVTKWDSRFVYPYLGFAVSSFNNGNIGWDASAKLFSWSGADRYKTSDLEFKLLFGPRSRKESSALKFRGYLGYRDFRWSGDFDEDNIAIHFSGPIFGLEFFF